MRTQTLIAIFAGIVLGASMTVAVRSLPQREMPKAEPADKCQIAKIAAEWFTSHYQNVELSKTVAKNDGIVISGNVAYRDGMFSSYGLEIAVCPSNETLVVRGTCPIEIHKDRMAMMREEFRRLAAAERKAM